MKEEFRISFDDYLKVCEGRGKMPDVSFTGAMEASVAAAVNGAANVAARPDGSTLREWLGEPTEQSTMRIV